MLAEGAAVLALEALDLAHARDATILPEIEGQGMTFASSESGHPTIDAEQIGAALQQALVSSGRIQAEGDHAEALGVRRIFGAGARHHLYTPALNSTTGHLLAASRLLSVAIMLGALADQHIPGTINLDHEDSECDLDANPQGTRDDLLRVVMVSATGRGHTAAILLAHPDAMRAAGGPVPPGA